MEAAADPVIGRDAELTAIDAFLTRAQIEFAVLTVEGEPGIGKTTLWQEALRRAGARGARVLLTCPTEAEATLSNAALGDLLDPVADEMVGRLPVPQREAISAVLLRTLPPRGGIDERALCASVLSVLRLLSAEGAVVVGVDDAQWLDSPSARVLSFAVRRLHAEPIGFVVTARRGNEPPTQRFDRAADPSRHQTVALGPLSLAALHEMIKHHTGRSLSRPTMVQLARACGGNPFYALEIAAALPDRSLQGGHLPVPATLSDLVAARIVQLPAATRRALFVASALAQPTVDLVDPGPLGAAEGAGIVSIEHGRIHFTHPLLASAVLSRADAAERRRLHCRLAATVTDPEERARHAALGAVRPDAAIAEELGVGAALARSRGAPGAAAELLELAVGLTPPCDAGERAARLVATANAWFDAGDLTRAQATIEEALAQLPTGRLRAQALHLLGQLHARRSSFTDAIAAGLQALEAADQDAELSADVELDIAYYCVSMGDLLGCVEHARGGVAAAERGATPCALADALACLTIAEFIIGRGVDEDRIARARTLEDPTRARAWQMSPTFIQGCLQLYTGRVDEALSTLGDLHTRTLERGEESPIPFSCFYLTWVCLWRGDLPAARRLVDQARQTAVLLDDPAARGIALSAGALLHAHDGSIDLARREAQDAIRIFEGLGWVVGTTWPLWALGLAELSSGNPRGVDAALGQVSAMLLTMPWGDPFLGVFLPDEIEALVELGELDRAEPLVEWLERRGAALDRPWARAAAGRCRGLLCAARGDYECALAALDGALAQHNRCTMPFERGRTLLALGRLQRRTGMRRQAKATLDQALTVFEEFGAPLWAERARSDLARLGRRAETSDALTPTEARVAELAASGLSNREIAERAFLTTKAVESNLTRVYSKLGIRSRGGLARALASGGPATEG